MNHSRVVAICRPTSVRRLATLCGLVITFMAVFLAGSPARAQALPPAVSLATLTNSGASLLVGDKLFTDFSIQGSFGAGQVTVDPIQLDGNYGIEFQGGFLADGSGADMILKYDVAVTNSPNLIAAANLGFNGFVPFGTGVASVVESVYTNSGSFYGEMAVYATATSSQLTNSLAIVPPQQLLELSKDVTVSAQLPAFAEISTIDQTFSQVPEPSVLVLTIMGAAGLGLTMRRRPKRRDC